MWDMIPIILFLLLISTPLIYFFWRLYNPKEVEIDESLRAKSEAYHKWLKTKSNEDYQKYLELKEAREIEVKKRGYRHKY